MAVTLEPQRRRDLGDAIREAREHRGWTQQQLANEAAKHVGKMSPTTIRSYEREGAIYPGRKFQGIARALGWPPDAVDRLEDGDRRFLYEGTRPQEPLLAGRLGATVNWPDDLIADLMAEGYETASRAAHDAQDTVRSIITRIVGHVGTDTGGNIEFHHRGRDYRVDVHITRPTEAEILRTVGAAHELRDLHGTVLLVVSTVDWPDESIRRVERAGAVFATLATLTEALGGKLD